MNSGDLITGFVFLAALLVVPFWKLLPSHGISKYYAFIAILPVGAVLLLWVLAFRDAFKDRA